MSIEATRSWEKEPTAVVLTEEGARKAALARGMSEMLDDVIDPATGPTPNGGWSVESLVRNFRFGDEMPTIVASAAPLLNLAHTIRYSEEEPDVTELRATAIEAVRRYERDLAGARISPERARAAHYVVCATVDDVVLSKQWGVRNGWARSGLVSTFHIDVTGGDRVFDLLDHFHKSPGANKDLLLLFYLCLSLAFEGRTRVSPRGALELASIRDSLYRTLAGQYGTFERELSPHWMGVAARHAPLRTAAALWTVLSLAALVLAFGYLFFTFSLNSASDDTFSELASLPPSESPSLLPLEHPAELQPTPAAAPTEPVLFPEPSEPEPSRPNPLDNFLAFLQPEVDRKLVTLSGTDRGLLILINNAGLFQIGSADVRPEFRGLLERIGGAIAAEKFRAVVVGYTDNIPIRTIQYPSNWHLSEARAKAVGSVLAAYAGSESILTEGRADSDPIATNDTPEGRAANRRTEILVLVDPATRLKGDWKPTLPDAAGNEGATDRPADPDGGVE